MITVKSRRRITAIAGSAALLVGAVIAGATMQANALAVNSGASGGQSSCQLANGIKHVVQFTFDNVHFFRDNPNVPSDLELMPNLLNFFTSNGTLLSNAHTPLIAHTADDILSTFTGLYGDRHGNPITNTFQAYNADGPGGTFNTTDRAVSFAYWTDPVFDISRPPNPAHDINPNMVYSPVPPATAATPLAPDTVTPAPWVPFTRAGCDVGQVAAANTVLENTAVDIPKVFGAGSPEALQLAADPNPLKNQETNDYVGVAVHCARSSPFCADATAVKFGQTTASPSATPDLLPQEPGGYDGFQGLFGHKYVAPQLGAGTPNLTVGGFQVTNGSGNLVDLNGNEIDGQFLKTPGFPGFAEINAAQSLAYVADMLGAGVPVVTTYISDVHGNEHIPGVSACVGAPSALGSGTPCYIAQARYYNEAFGTFFARLAAMGITPANTLFLLSSDEGDHEAGANVDRFIEPTPAGCDGVTVPCNYPAGTFGELAGNMTGLLATQKGNTTPFTLQADTAPEFYVRGNPGPTDPAVRALEHDVAGLTAFNPYTGTTQNIVNYIASPVEMGILHMVNADPARTPTFAVFARPDYFLSAGATTCPAAGCVTVNPAFAYVHGGYAAEINTTYLGLAGPGVANLGLDGSAPADGPSSAGQSSGQIAAVNSSTGGTWTEETDMEPTELFLTGLKAGYTQDGQVLSGVLATVPTSLQGGVVQQLGACYRQLNSSVGEFANYTLRASTRAANSATAGDAEFTQVNDQLLSLEKQRDALAVQVKNELNAAAFDGTPIANPSGQLAACQGLISAAQQLAQSS